MGKNTLKEGMGNILKEGTRNISKESTGNISLGRRVRPFVKPYRISLITMLFCELIMVLVDLIGPLIFAVMIDEVFYHRNLHFFGYVILTYIALYLGVRALSWIIKSIWIYLNVKFLFDIRRKLFDRILHFKASNYEKAKTGDLITRLTSDAESIMQWIEVMIFEMAAPLTKLLISYVFLFYLNPYIALAMMVLVPVSVWVSQYFNRKMTRQQTVLRGKYGHFVSWMLEMLQGMRDIRLLGSGKRASLLFAGQSADVIRLDNRTEVMKWMSTRSNAFIFLLSDLCIYAVAGVLIVQGQLTAGIFVAIMSYLSKNNQSMMMIYEAVVNLPKLTVQSHKVFDLLEEEVERTDGHPELDLQHGEISFAQVRFRYENGPRVLDGLDLHVGARESVALVGKSGSGKTTLVNMLLGFYTPEEGEIRIGGRPIGQYTLTCLRKRVGIVQQESILFNESIRYNLLLGSAHADDEQLWEACDQAYIGDFIRSLPEGLDTQLGAGGMELSGGQKQRLSIARIFLKQPCLIIFDEATSALDYEAEQAIQQSWQHLSRDRASIIIAHRLSSILNADRIAVLHEGRIVAEGTHGYLLENSEHYRELFVEDFIRKEGMMS
ncbi:ABC transporter ATP-binding protein [Paenibacillus sp. AN1007]|uniref:ABC transporter ATP-binding protein n=1 Tax=Paenibacillus sp. AN1007 TaxID=3151385 RepID=A0AAU8NFL3_9BACL